MKNILIGLAIVLYRFAKAMVLIPLCIITLIIVWPFVTLYDIGKERKWNE